MAKDKLQIISNTFNENYYKDNYTNYSWDALAIEFERTASYINSRFLPKSVLDVGCAKGFLVKALAGIGVPAKGIDASGYAVTNPVEGVEGMLHHGLVQNLPFKDREFDTVICFDVLEHVPEAEAERACAELMRVTDRLLVVNVMTTETPDFTDPTHINVQSREFWLEKLLKHGGEEIPYNTYGTAVWWFNLPDRSIVIKK